MDSDQSDQLAVGDSILDSTKQRLGIERDYHEYDLDVMAAINSAFYSLRQLGVGPDLGFTISGSDDSWEAFSDDPSQLAEVQTYIYLKVRLLFDPPTNSFLVQSIERQISEMEWRLNVHAEGAFDA